MTAARADRELYKYCSTPYLDRSPQLACGTEYRLVTCTFPDVCGGIGHIASVGSRYKRCYGAIYRQPHATPAGPNRHIGRTETEMAGRVDHNGRISRIRSSEDIKGGIR